MSRNEALADGAARASAISASGTERSSMGAIKPLAPSSPKPDVRLDGGDFLLLRHAEGGAAAASGDDVRVVDLEARALHGLDVVDDRAAHVGQRRRVDQDA